MGRGGGGAWTRPKMPRQAVAEAQVKEAAARNPPENARQLLMRLKRETQPIDIKQVQGARGIASETPTTYSDGSANPPGAATDSLAGADVWRPGRSLQTSPPSNVEETYAIMRQEPEGVVLTTTLRGAIQTPMRAELCGAIVSLAAGKGGQPGSRQRGSCEGH